MENNSTQYFYTETVLLLDGTKMMMEMIPMVSRDEKVSCRERRGSS